MNSIVSVFKKWTDISLVLRILVGLVIGAVLGLIAPGWTWIGILGSIFVSALKAAAPVLVAVLVMASIARAHGGLGSRFRTVSGDGFHLIFVDYIDASIYYCINRKIIHTNCTVITKYFC